MQRKARSSLSYKKYKQLCTKRQRLNKHWNGISIHDPQSTRLVKQSANKISWKLVPCTLHILKHTIRLFFSHQIIHIKHTKPNSKYSTSVFPSNSSNQIKDLSHSSKTQEIPKDLNTRHHN